MAQQKLLTSQWLLRSCLCLVLILFCCPFLSFLLCLSSSSVFQVIATSLAVVQLPRFPVGCVCVCVCFDVLVSLGNVNCPCGMVVFISVHISVRPLCTSVVGVDLLTTLQLRESMCLPLFLLLLLSSTKHHYAIVFKANQYGFTSYGRNLAVTLWIRTHKKIHFL